METNIQSKLNELNELYHRLISSRFIFIDRDIEQFKSLIKLLKGMGYKFRLATPEIDFTAFTLSDIETKLFSCLELVRQEKKFGISNQLYKYVHLMRGCEKILSREIYVSLCKRQVLEKNYFQIKAISKWIDFVQSGHLIDIHILF